MDDELREALNQHYGEIHEAALKKQLAPKLSVSCSAWPMVSDALAVHPKQVEEANARNKRHGVNVQYLPNGQAVLPDRNERKKLLRLERYHDNDGGYGD